MSNFEERKPHAVMIPYPLQGHINPMFKFAKLLHLRGFHITFVNTEYNHKRLLKSRGSNSLDGLPDYVFETIQDGLTQMEGDSDVIQDIYFLNESIRNNFLQYLHELLARLKKSSNVGLVAPVTCLVSEGAMTFSVQDAEELSLPIVFLCPASACSFLYGLHIGSIFDKGLITLKTKGIIRQMVNELMVGEKCDRMRQKAVELKKKAKEDTRSGGFVHT